MCGDPNAPPQSKTSLAAVTRLRTSEGRMVWVQGQGQDQGQLHLLQGHQERQLLFTILVIHKLGSVGYLDTFLHLNQDPSDFSSINDSDRSALAASRHNLLGL